MQEIYTSYKCKRCKKEFVLMTDEVVAHTNMNKYVVCPYCSNKELEKEKRTDSIKEVMGARSYKRKNGAIHQK